MGLILPQTVEVTVVSQNCIYYKNKGYDIKTQINKKGKEAIILYQKINVNILDLPKGSHYYIKCTCDKCNKEQNIVYCSYTKMTKKHNGKIYCTKCAAELFRSKENSWNYNPLLTDEDRYCTRKYTEYQHFVQRVLARDNYTCQCCRKYKGGDLEVHHLNGYNWFKEGRTDESNAVALCLQCHANFHSIYGKGNNTKKQYEEWIGESINLLQKYNGKLPIARKVYCVEHDILYNSAKELSDKIKCDVNAIYRVCNKETSHIKGYHVLWEENYNNYSKEELLELKNKKEKIRPIKVICITTGIIFNSIKSALSYYNLKATYRLTCCCQNIIDYYGKLPDGTRLEWMYYDDFLKLPIEEQNEILSRNNESSTDGSFLLDKEAM